MFKPLILIAIPALAATQAFAFDLTPERVSILTQGVVRLGEANLWPDGSDLRFAKPAFVPWTDAEGLREVNYSARMRSTNIAHILSLDLNGDLEVTPEEAQIAKDGDTFFPWRDVQALFDDFDANRDGEIVLNEMSIDQWRLADLRREENSFRLLKLFDEFEASGTAGTLEEAIFAQFDIDANGVISPAEGKAMIEFGATAVLEPLSCPDWLPAPGIAVKTCLWAMTQDPSVIAAHMAAN